MKITKNGFKTKQKEALTTIRKQHLHNYCIEMKQLLLSFTRKNEAKKRHILYLLTDKNEKPFFGFIIKLLCYSQLSDCTNENSGDRCFTGISSNSLRLFFYSFVDE